MESRSCGIPRGVRESKASANRGEGEFVIVISSLASADKRSHFYPALRVEEARAPHFSNNRPKEAAYADHCAGRWANQFLILQVLATRPGKSQSIVTSSDCARSSLRLTIPLTWLIRSMVWDTVFGKLHQSDYRHEPSRSQCQPIIR